MSRKRPKKIKTSPRLPQCLETGAPHHRQPRPAGNQGGESLRGPRRRPGRECSLERAELQGPAVRLGRRRGRHTSPPGAHGWRAAYLGGRAGVRAGRPRERGAERMGEERRGGRVCYSGAPLCFHPRLCGAARRPAPFIRGRSRPRRLDWLPAAGSRGGSADARRGPATIGRAAERAPPGEGEPARKERKGKGRGGGALGEGRGRWWGEEGRDGKEAGCVRRGDFLQGSTRPTRAPLATAGRPRSPGPGLEAPQQTALGLRPCSPQCSLFAKECSLSVGPIADPTAP